MGAAAHKQASADERAARPSTRQPSCNESIIVPSSPGTPALVSFDIDSSEQPNHKPPPPQQQPRGPQSTPMKMTSSPSGAFLEASSGRARLAASRSPGSISRHGEDSVTRPPLLRHFVRRHTQSSTTTTATMSSSPPNESNLYLNSLSEGYSAAPATPVTTTSTRVPAALTTTMTAGAAATPSSSLNSSCSAFSLYSAESSPRELPPPPAQLRVTEGVTSSSAVDVKPAAAAPTETVTRAAIVDCNNNEWMSQSPPASPAHADAVSFPGPHHAPPPSSADTSCALFAKARAAAESTPAVAPSLSHFLLDMSFDSRALTASPASTSAEIQRIGTRLQHCRCSPAPDSPSRVNTLVACTANQEQQPHPTNAVLTGEDAVLMSSATFTPTEPEGTMRAYSKLPPLFTPSHEAAAEQPRVDTTDTTYYTETVKFVQMIQQLQRAREAERTSCTWFRSGAVQAAAAPSGNPTSNVSFDSFDHPVKSEAAAPAATKCCSSGDHAQSSSFDIGRNRSKEGDGGTEVETEQRASIRRRDRLFTAVHWVPYETHECEPLTPLGTVGTAACFCGFFSSTSSSPQTESGMAPQLFHSTDCSRVGSAEATWPRLPQTELPSPTSFAGAETPPLPSILAAVPHGGRSSSEVEKLSPVSADDSGPHLTSSTATSIDSLTSCPVHVVFRPPSIYVVRHREKNRSSSINRVSSPVRRQQQLVSGQVDVPPSTVNTPLPFATPLLPDKHMEERRREPISSNTSSSNNGDSSSPSASTSCGERYWKRRAIIDVGVPHRRQLAKKALEDNQLFWEFTLQRQKAEALRTELAGVEKH